MSEKISYIEGTYLEPEDLAKKFGCTEQEVIDMVAVDGTLGRCTMCTKWTKLDHLGKDTGFCLSCCNRLCRDNVVVIGEDDGYCD